MGGFFSTAVGKFITAIFVGAPAAASTAYVFAVNVARLAVVSLTARLASPRLDFSDKARRKTVTLRDVAAYQQFIYGEDLVSGPIIFANVGGTNNADLYYCIAFAGHEVDSAQAYRVDDTDIPLAVLSGSEDGTVDSGDFNGAMEIELLKGGSTQSASTLLTSAFSSNWTSSHTARGWATMIFKMSAHTTNQTAYKNGAPRNFRIRVRGKQVYDPRLDTSPGANPDNASYIAWSNNPALALADWLRDDKFGMGESDSRIDWDRVVTAANVCEETVTVPSGTQNRYTINGTFSTRSRRRSVRDSLVNAMMGRLVFAQGTWQMWAGEAVTADVTLTEANLAGSIQLQASAGSKDRFNRVRGKFVDSARDYTPAMYPEIRSSTYESEDGGEVRELVADFQTVTNTYEAQRNAIITLKRSRNQRVLVFEGNYSCFRIQPGATVNLTIDELGFSGEKFFVTEWKFGASGINLTMIEEDDSAWSDPSSPGDYTVRSATGTLTFSDIGVPPPTSLTATGILQGIQLSWTNPSLGTFKYIEILASDDNNRSNAVVIDQVTADRYIEELPNPERRNRYYWVRAVNDFGETSDYEPDLTTTTASDEPSREIPTWILDPEFDRSDSDPPNEFWQESITQGTSPPRTGDIAFVSSGGQIGNAYDLTNAGASNSKLRLQSKKRIRFRGKATFQLSVRYETQGSTDSDDHENCHFSIGVADSESGGTVTWLQSPDVTLPRRASWGTFDIVYDIESLVEPTTHQFVMFRFGWDGPGGTADDLRLDSLQVLFVGRSFGDLDDTNGKPQGLVPSALTADSSKFLQGDGTWTSEIRTQDSDGTGNTAGAETLDHNQVWSDVGFNDLREFNDDTSDTLEARHSGRINVKDDAAAVTLTLEASTSTDFPVEHVTHIMNSATSGNYTITEGSGTTLYYIDPGTGAVDTAGGCTVGPGGNATIWRRSTTVYYIWGSEITA